MLPSAPLHQKARFRSSSAWAPTTAPQWPLVPLGSYCLLVCLSLSTGSVSYSCFILGTEHEAATCRILSEVHWMNWLLREYEKSLGTIGLLGEAVRNLNGGLWDRAHGADSNPRRNNLDFESSSIGLMQSCICPGRVAFMWSLPSSHVPLMYR